jgi:hypothetical protein
MGRNPAPRFTRKEEVAKMALVCHLGIPVWTVALCAMVVTWPTRPPPITMLLGVAIFASMTMLMVRGLGLQRLILVPAVGVIGPREGTTPDIDALDLVRMDDDGGSRAPTDRR